MFDLSGKCALVTGASSGLGWQFARTLARQGAAVAAAARREERLVALVAEIEAAGGTALALAMDVTSRPSIEAALDRVAGWRGTPEVLVNNAGVASTQSALDTSDAQWDEVVGTNLKGAWQCAQAFAARQVAAGQSASIVNITSISAMRAIGGIAPYAASKAALEQLTRNLALEWARHGIRVNAIAPGYIETDINRAFFASEPGRAMIKRIPQRRLGRPADLDGALLLLASDASAYMTGASIVVDGGQLQAGL